MATLLETVPDTAPAAVSAPRVAILFGVIAVAVGFGLGLALTTLGTAPSAETIVAMSGLFVGAISATYALKCLRENRRLRTVLVDAHRSQTFIDNATEGFFRTKGDGSYLRANHALAQIYGYDSPTQLADELTDIANTLYVDPDRREKFRLEMKEYGRVTEFVSQIRCRDGTMIWISENARAVTDENGDLVFYEGTVKNVTAQREAEAAMRRALQETQEAARAKAAFLASMSHELKTPLNAIIGFSDIMRQEMFGPVSEPRYRTYVIDIFNNGRRLLGIINDVLDFTRAEGGLLALDDEVISLPALIEDARHSVTPHDKCIATISVSLRHDLPALRGDRKRLQQVLGHLISNAIKFTPAVGAITIATAGRPDGALVISVSDNGIGMAPDRVSHALQPFRQLDERLARRFEGVGVGLPLARSLLALHGASLELESAVGKGTSAIIVMPPSRLLPATIAA